MEKGIIAAPARVFGNGTQFRFDRVLTREDLRYLLLYWDKVVIPTTNLVHVGLPEEEELLATGVFTRPRVAFSGSFDGEAIAKAQALAQTQIARDLVAKDSSTDWVIHQLGDGIILPDTETIQRQLIRVNLVQALPVPNADATVADILDFKFRRRDEFLQLHEVIDELYIEVLRSPDQSLSGKQAVSRFTASIASLDKVSSERWKSTSKFDLTAELNIKGTSIVAGAASGAAFDFFTSLYTIPVGTLVGAFASLIKVKAVSAKTFEPAKNRQVLGYLANARQEGLLSSRPSET